MDAMERSAARKKAVQDAVMRIRAIETAQGVTRTSLDDIKAVLLELAAQKDLFPLSDFTHPGGGEEVKNALYRLHEDEDHRFALYGQMSTTSRDTPAHDHTTWAIVVGMHGQELNKFYDHDDGGVKYVREEMVEAGTGVAMLPEDLHSIHIARPGAGAELSHVRAGGWSSFTAAATTAPTPTTGSISRLPKAFRTCRNPHETDHRH